jgi:outer membrane protein assembly factor BamA
MIRIAQARRMLARRTIALALLALTAEQSLAQTAAVETLGEVRVHGNHTTPDDVVLSLAGLTIGTPVTETMLAQAEDRLRKSGRFADVEVRKRFRSLDNPSDVLAIVLVDELTAVSSDDLMPGPLKRVTGAGMWLPIVNYADGYGFTYGGRVSFVNGLGPRSRISVPLTWGGERKAAVELDRTFDSGPFTRISGSLGISRRVNPFFDFSDIRNQAEARAERALTPYLRVGGTTRVTYVRSPVEERHITPGVDVVLDTRIDPAFPRNAVHVVAGLEQLRFEHSPHVRRWTTDARGYVGLIGPSVLAVRAVASQASDALPGYEQALLGGTDSLRGYDFGYRAGDNLTAFSAEVRVPLTSPVRVGRFGVKGFVDTGTVYLSGQKLSDQRFDRGIGGGVFFTATVVRAGLDVAWANDGSHSPRWHFGLGVTF